MPNTPGIRIRTSCSHAPPACCSKTDTHTHHTQGRKEGIVAPDGTCACNRARTQTCTQGCKEGITALNSCLLVREHVVTCIPHNPATRPCLNRRGAIHTPCCTRPAPPYRQAPLCPTSALLLHIPTACAASSSSHQRFTHVLLTLHPLACTLPPSSTSTAPTHVLDAPLACSLHCSPFTGSQTAVPAPSPPAAHPAARAAAAQAAARLQPRLPRP